jgi:TPP-dependent pyruvate/acetoin dehydrogenase alpha subunit
MALGTSSVDRQGVLHLYHQMLRLRRLSHAGGMSPAWRGVESVPAGVVAALGPQDAVASAGGGGRAVAVLQGADAAELGQAGEAAGDTGAAGWAMAAALSLARRSPRGQGVTVCLLAPGQAFPRLHGLVRCAGRARWPVVFVLPPRRALPRGASADALAAARPARPRQLARLDVDALDAVAVRLAVSWAMQHARSGSGPVLVQPRLLEPDWSGDGGQAALGNEFRCDPIERLLAWGRDQGLIGQCDCVRLEGLVRREIDGFVRGRGGRAPQAPRDEVVKQTVD